MHYRNKVTYGFKGCYPTLDYKAILKELDKALSKRLSTIKGKKNYGSVLVFEVSDVLVSISSIGTIILLSNSDLSGAEKVIVDEVLSVFRSYIPGFDLIKN